MARSPHTTAYRGKRVRVVLRNGEVIVDKYVEHHSRSIVLQKNKILTKNIKSFTIVKSQVLR